MANIRSPGRAQRKPGQKGLILKIITRFIFCFLFVYWQPTFAAESGSAALKQFFNGLTSITAEFEQTVQNAQLSTVDQASGQLWILRPGKFRWNYSQPYEQEIVSNGNKIWIFDADLEQVTVKDAKTALGHTPALLLSGTQPVEESFVLNDLDSDTDLAWVELTPRNEDAGFNGIRLGFKNNNLREMLLQDNLGQITRISFSNLKTNQTIDSSLFDFKVPEGADVFETTE